MSEVLNDAVNTTMEVIEKAPKPKGGDWKKYAVGFLFGAACVVTADYISKKRKAKNKKSTRKTEVEDEEAEVAEVVTEEVEATKKETQTKKSEKK